MFDVDCEDFVVVVGLFGDCDLCGVVGKVVWVVFEILNSIWVVK